MRSPWDESLHLDETVQSECLFITFTAFFQFVSHFYICVFQNETTMSVYHLDELYLTIGYSIHGHYLTIHAIDDLRPRGGSMREVNLKTKEIGKHFGVDRGMFLATIEPLLIAMFRRPFKLLVANNSEMNFFDSIFP